MINRMFFIIIISLCFASCKNNIFLTKKYVHKTVNSCTNNNQNSLIAATKNKQQPALLVLHTITRTDLIVSNTIVPNNLSGINISKKPAVKSVVTICKKSVFLSPIVLNKKIIKQNIKTKTNDSNYSGFKLILMLLAFWIIAIALYSNVFAIEIASILGSLQIIGIVLLSVLVSVGIYYLFILFYNSVSN